MGICWKGAVVGRKNGGYSYRKTGEGGLCRLPWACEIFWFIGSCVMFLLQADFWNRSLPTFARLPLAIQTLQQDSSRCLYRVGRVMGRPFAHLHRDRLLFTKVLQPLVTATWNVARWDGRRLDWIKYMCALLGQLIILSATIHTIYPRSQYRLSQRLLLQDSFNLLIHPPRVMFVYVVF